MMKIDFSRTAGILREDKADVDMKATLVQQAYEELAEELRRIPLWTADWEQAVDYLEAYIFGRTAQEYSLYCLY